ncbi:sulfate ABC transporter permease [Heliorestis convoluta]|uniref:Sulfate ABC transporter, permease family protein Cysw n=1 Tax=Heliorestis convoluta TaxID=356322 RepID=A0A5Q2N5A7_9FIRM|nr:sulfate ABC transporter permease subunit [Heliorestis convoluta]QGG49123.1 sulfate ABC transporter, permease family protein Cysw [Heliorestis convoluta]
MKKNRIFAGLLYVWFTLFLIAPVGALVVGTVGYGLDSFWHEITRPEAIHALKLTFIITVIVLCINTLLGLLTAYVMTRQKFWGQNFINGLVDLPFAVSPVIAGLMILLLYGPQGIIGMFFSEMTFSIIFALPGMIIATLFITYPFMVREVMPLLQEMGKSQEEVAYTLGASRWMTFWKVTLPSIKWGVLYGMVLTIARSLGEFGAVLVVSGNIIMATQSATLYVYQAATDFNMAAAFAVSLVLAGTSFVILIFLELLKRKKGVIES